MIAWFGARYPSVFGDDGGLKDAQEGSGKVMAFADEMLEQITRKLGGSFDDEGEEEPREEAKAEVDVGGE